MDLSWNAQRVLQTLKLQLQQDEGKRAFYDWLEDATIYQSLNELLLSASQQPSLKEGKRLIRGWLDKRGVGGIWSSLQTVLLDDLRSQWAGSTDSMNALDEAVAELGGTGTPGKKAHSPANGLDPRNRTPQRSKTPPPSRLAPNSLPRRTRTPASTIPTAKSSDFSRTRTEPYFPSIRPSNRNNQPGDFYPEQNRAKRGGQAESSKREEQSTLSFGVPKQVNAEKKQRDDRNERRTGGSRTTRESVSRIKRSHHTLPKLRTQDPTDLPSRKSPRSSNTGPSDSAFQRRRSTPGIQALKRENTNGFQLSLQDALLQVQKSQKNADMSPAARGVSLDPRKTSGERTPTVKRSHHKLPKVRKEEVPEKSAAEKNEASTTGLDLEEIKKRSAEIAQKTSKTKESKPSQARRTGAALERVSGKENLDDQEDRGNSEETKKATLKKSQKAKQAEQEKLEKEKARLEIENERRRQRQEEQERQKKLEEIKSTKNNKKETKEKKLKKDKKSKVKKSKGKADDSNDQQKKQLMMLAGILVFGLLLYLLTS